MDTSRRIDSCLTSKIKGFTVIEVLMTISLVSILGAIATTQYLDFRNDAKSATTSKKIYEIKEAIVGNPEIIANGQFVRPGFLVDLGSAPSSLSSLVSQGAYSSFSMFEKRGWRGPYVNSAVPNWSQDSWGTDLSYSNSSRWIKSCGPDKICAGANAADDITVSF